MPRSDYDELCALPSDLIVSHAGVIAMGSNMDGFIEQFWSGLTQDEIADVMNDLGRGLLNGASFSARGTDASQ